MSEKGFRIEIRVPIKRYRRGLKVTKDMPQQGNDSIPRIAQRLALAHKWDALVQHGEVKCLIRYQSLGRKYIPAIRP